MLIELFKKRKPLVHCITNPISINQCANLILALSCRPIMAEHPEEVREITRTSASLLLNIGNITDVRMKSIMLSAEEASLCNIPTVFDAVGVACSSLRRNFTYSFLKSYTPVVLKGNYSEIKALCDTSYFSSGVDSEQNLNISEIVDAAATLSRQKNCIVLASGKTDIITDGSKVVYIKNGCKKMGTITGSGCMLGAAVACSLSVSSDIQAVAEATALLGICGELSDKSSASGSFYISFMDKLSSISDEDIKKYIKKEEFHVEKL